MANLIDLDLLTYYDTKIKAYIIDKLSSGAPSDNINFTTYNNLPSVGQKGILYVTENSVY